MGYVKFLDVLVLAPNVFAPFSSCGLQVQVYSTINTYLYVEFVI